MIRKDLIENELKYIQEKLGIKFKSFKPSNKKIDWIYNHYNIDEFSEHWYDLDEDSDLLCGRPPIEVNNWIDMWGPGIWDTSQKKANKFSKNNMKWYKKHLPALKERFWIAETKWVLPEMLFVYCYARDIYKEDLWWCFLKKFDK